MTRRMLRALCELASAPRRHRDASPRRARRIVWRLLAQHTRRALLEQGLVVEQPAEGDEVASFGIGDEGWGAVRAARLLGADPFGRKPLSRSRL